MIDEQELAAALRELCIKREYIVFGPVDEAADMLLPPKRSVALIAINDHDWREIVGSGLLPDVPSQAHVLDNRTMLSCILTVIGGQPWTALRDSPVTPEAARKKFARLTERGVWKELAEWAASADLSLQIKHLLLAANHRAARTTI